MYKLLNDFKMTNDNIISMIVYDTNNHSKSISFAFFDILIWFMIMMNYIR